MLTARTVLSGVALAAVLAAAPARASTPLPAASPREISLEAYRQHLADLQAVVAACARARDTKSCDPDRVGPDDRVPVPGGPRLILYAWLRALLAEAPMRDKAKARSTVPAKDNQDQAPAAPTTAELLRAAGQRLAQDRELADTAPAPPMKPCSVPATR